jgi:hypothetical protein
LRKPALKNLLFQSASLEERYARLVGIAKHALTEIDGAIQYEQLLERGNDKIPVLQAAFDDHPAVPIVQAIHRAAVSQITLSLMRLHDPAREQRNSLSTVDRLLSDAPLVGLLATKRDPAFRIQGEPSTLKQVDAFRSEWARLLDGPHRSALEALRHARDAHLGHSLEVPLPARGDPKYGELFSVLNETASLTYRLGAIVGVAYVNHEGVRRIWAERADSYWEALRIGALQTKLGENS